MNQQMQLSFAVLLTGLVIVFVMLVVLAYIIKGYGVAVSKIEKKIEGKQAGAQSLNSAMAANASTAPTSVAEDGIPTEVVAAISAAVYMMYGTSAGQITSIRRAAQPKRSAWRMAGLLENTRPF